MPPKKGEFPERPPTLAEALYGGKEMGTKPENYEQILKDLNLDALKKPDVKKEEEKSVKLVKSDKDKQQKPKSKPVKQVDVHIDSPLPAEASTTIESNFILPNQCEAVTNLQMDYILNRKSMFIRSILNSRVFSSFAFGLITIVSYYKIGDYFNEFTFKKGYLDGAKSLLKNGYFVEDFFTMFFIIMIIIATLFTVLKFITSPIQEEANNVPKNFESYFNVDLNEYATLTNIDKNFNKLSKTDKEIVKKMKENSFCIVYRDSPVAFLSWKQIESTDGIDIKIIGYGIRRIYVKAELFKDLIGMLFKKFILSENKVNSISLDVYSFETFDINILKRAGFFRKERKSIGFLVSTILGITKDTYSFESESIEF